MFWVLVIPSNFIYLTLQFYVLHLSYLLWHLDRGHVGSYLVMFMVELFLECVREWNKSKVHSFGIKTEETVASNAATAQSYHKQKQVFIPSVFLLGILCCTLWNFTTTLIKRGHFLLHPACLLILLLGLYPANCERFV